MYISAICANIHRGTFGNKKDSHTFDSHNRISLKKGN